VPKVAARMYKDGITMEEIRKKSMLPKEFIEMVIENIKK